MQHIVKCLLAIKRKKNKSWNNIVQFYRYPSSCTVHIHEQYFTYICRPTDLCAIVATMISAVRQSQRRRKQRELNNLRDLTKKKKIRPKTLISSIKEEIRNAENIFHTFESTESFNEMNWPEILPTCQKQMPKLFKVLSAALDYEYADEIVREYRSPMNDSFLPFFFPARSP